MDILIQDKAFTLNALKKAKTVRKKELIKLIQ